MSVGGGGGSTEKFIKDIIFKYIGNEILEKMTDGATLDIPGEKAVFTTDSFVVKPEFFLGGDIGKLAVCGTVNDIAVCGGIPKYLSLGLILPEGYEMAKLEKILSSMGQAAKEAGVQIVCGDTKVVDNASLDSPILNCSGIGIKVEDYNNYDNVKSGNSVIITSDIARHGVSVLLARGDLGFESTIETDCAPLNKMIENLHGLDIKFCRDATRGGVAAVLNEIASMSGVGFELDEVSIPLDENVSFVCEMLGFDPLSVANEGVAVIIVSDTDAQKVLDMLTKHKYGLRSAVVGITDDSGKVVIKTEIGGKRNVSMPSGELLPRIC